MGLIDKAVSFFWSPKNDDKLDPSLTIGKPVGWWRCVHVKPDSAFSRFTVGHLYYCANEGNLARRVYPYEGSTWGPYWEEHNQRFCYDRTDIDFEYLGPIPPVLCHKCGDLETQLLGNSEQMPKARQS